MRDVQLRLFALNATRELGGRIAAALGRALDPHEEREFEDGEHKARPLVDVRGADVYVIQGMHGDAAASANDKLIRLLFFAGALRDHGAARVTAVVPYLAYARKDRVTKPRDPVTTRYVAQLFETIGIDAVVALEVHNVVALQNAFRIPTLHLDAATLFIERAAALAAEGALAVVSPDPGGVKRAQLFREALESHVGRPVGSAYLEKRRSAGVVSGSLLAGDVRGATVLLFDDLISTGGTMVRAAETCLAHGAQRVFALAAHGLFNEGANAAIVHPALAGTLVSDSVPPFRLDAAARARVEIVSCAPLLAQAIESLHLGFAARS
ncbi:MAG: ribose-phosphate diphosphokinase [Gemmatimonadota bacterium]